MLISAPSGCTGTLLQGWRGTKLPRATPSVAAAEGHHLDRCLTHETRAHRFQYFKYMQNRFSQQLATPRISVPQAEQRRHGNPHDADSAPVRGTQCRRHRVPRSATLLHQTAGPHRTHQRHSSGTAIRHCGANYSPDDVVPQMAMSY